MLKTVLHMELKLTRMPNHPNRSRAKSPASNPTPQEIILARYIYLMTKQNNRHGGARSGSGRKKMDAGKKQRITFTLSDDVIDFLKSKRPASRTLELAVREYANRLEQETKNSPT